MVIGGVLFFLWSGGELLIYVTMATAGDPSVLLLTVSVFYPLRYDGENIKKRKHCRRTVLGPIDDHRSRLPISINNQTSTSNYVVGTEMNKR